MLSRLAHPELFYAFIVVAGLELIAMQLWLPMYFRTGLPILRLSFPLPPSVRELPAESSLSYSLRSEWTGNVVFKELSAAQLAFQNTSGKFVPRFFPVMHGLIRFLPDQRRGEVVGYANYSPCVFIASFVFNSPPEWRLMSIPFLIGLFLLLPYCIESLCYTKVRAALNDYAAACAMAANAPPVWRSR